MCEGGRKIERERDRERERDVTATPFHKHAPISNYALISFIMWLSQDSLSHIFPIKKQLSEKQEGKENIKEGKTIFGKRKVANGSSWKTKSKGSKPD